MAKRSCDGPLSPAFKDKYEKKQVLGDIAKILPVKTNGKG
jgi:hypothetical protein